MKIHVIGKQFREGTSKKSGKPYAGTTVYFSCTRNGVVGEVADSCFLSADTYPKDSIIIGSNYDLDRDNGYVLSFEPVPGK